MDQTEAARAASEARHRLANVQQLLSALARLRSQRAEDPETARQLLWMADAVSLLGILERRRVGDQVDFAEFLTEMAPVWRRRHPARSVEVVLKVEPFLAADNVASTLALIAQELVINAITHAAMTQACTVTISLSRQGDQCELVVADDGPGLPPDGPRERFGLWLVRSLATQVRGVFTLENQAGAVARLSFPL
jgi:two-component sensor histidine kinase